MKDDFIERIVLDDPSARKILRARFRFAPGRERLQAAKHDRVAARQLQALPGILRRKGKTGWIRKALHFLVEPGTAPGLFELLHHAREHRREVCDVGYCIVDLPLVERTPAPIGEARALVEAVAKQALDEVGVADLFSVAEGHCGNLRVEERMRHLAGEVMDDLEILAPGMKYLQHV